MGKSWRARELAALVAATGESSENPKSGAGEVSEQVADVFFLSTVHWIGSIRYGTPHTTPHMVLSVPCGRRDC